MRIQEVDLNSPLGGFPNIEQEEYMFEEKELSLNSVSNTYYVTMPFVCNTKKCL